MTDSLLNATNAWLKTVPLQDDPEWTTWCRLLRASAEALDNNYQASIASEYRKLAQHMAEYSKGSGGDTLDKILRRNDG